jgi:hypothetical protein
MTARKEAIVASCANRLLRCFHKSTFFSLSRKGILHSHSDGVFSPFNNGNIMIASNPPAIKVSGVR